MTLYVSDTILYMTDGIIRQHTKTKEKPRLTDGRRHPVKIIKPEKKSDSKEK